MKKLLIILIFILMKVSALAVNYDGLKIDWLELEKKSNSIIITPDCNLQERYDWLKSSDRDAKMGALSYDNRRAMLFVPGDYILRGTLNIDADFVDFRGLGTTGNVNIINSPTYIPDPCTGAFYQTSADNCFENLHFGSGDRSGIKINNLMTSGTGAVLTSVVPHLKRYKLTKTGAFPDIFTNDLIYMSSADANLTAGWYGVAEIDVNNVYVYGKCTGGSTTINGVSFKVVSMRSRYIDLSCGNCGVSAPQAAIWSVVDLGGTIVNFVGNTHQNPTTTSNIWAAAYGTDNTKIILAKVYNYGGLRYEAYDTFFASVERSGAVFFNNYTRASSINGILCRAVPGRNFGFVRSNINAGCDFRITPNALDRLILANGTAMDLGEYYENVADDFGWVYIYCYEYGKWLITDEKGTWTQQNP